MENQDHIVVFRSYENNMDANLAKSKLDAYGIPCFLSNENAANLYPIQNARFSMRLHIFQNDEEQVRQVLSESVYLQDAELTRCPRCGSEKLEWGYTRKITSLFPTLLFSVFVAIFPPRRVCHCLDCHQEF
jgi:hypothetical protein